MIKNIISFLRSLRRHNDRAWFNENKAKYLDIKDSVDILASRLIAGIADFDPDASRLRPSDCTYRIYRDTRFSNDKTPYKTHIGIFLNPPGGKKALTAGYYLHLEPGNCLFCAGSYALPGPLVRRQRKAIYDEIEEYREIVESPEFTALFSELGMNKVKTAPQGFPRDWEFIEYIKPRDFGATAYLDDGFITAPDLVGRLRPYFEQAKKYNDFINFPITENED